jgi:hypothetical protein
MVWECGRRNKPHPRSSLYMISSALHKNLQEYAIGVSFRIQGLRRSHIGEGSWHGGRSSARRYGSWPRPRCFELRSVLRPKRGPETGPQGYAPTATRSRNRATPRETSRKGDISNELREGTFLNSYDFHPRYSLTSGHFLRILGEVSWEIISSIMQTRYYYWFAFTYRFPWVGSGQGRIARDSR